MGEEAIRRNEGDVPLVPPRVQRVQNKTPQDLGKTSAGGGLWQLTIEETVLCTRQSRGYGLMA